MVIMRKSKLLLGTIFCYPILNLADTLFMVHGPQWSATPSLGVPGLYLSFLGFRINDEVLTGEAESIFVSFNLIIAAVYCYPVKQINKSQHYQMI